MATDVELVGSGKMKERRSGAAKGLTRFLTTVAISCGGDSIAGSPPACTGSSVRNVSFIVPTREVEHEEKPSH